MTSEARDKCRQKIAAAYAERDTAWANHQQLAHDAEQAWREYDKACIRLILLLEQERNDQ